MLTLRENYKKKNLVFLKALLCLESDGCIPIKEGQENLVGNVSVITVFHYSIDLNGPGLSCSAGAEIQRLVLRELLPK